MTIDDTRARIKARVWQALAQSDLSIKELPREDMEELVDMVTNAALVEVDETIGTTLSSVVAKPKALEDDEEEILWEGRPFLSIATQYVITNQRVRIIEGILGKDREDIELVRIQDIDQGQSISERLLNLGDITIRSHDPSHPVVELRNVKDPQHVHEILRRAMLNAREKYRLTFQDEM